MISAFSAAKVYMGSNFHWESWIFLNIYIGFNLEITNGTKLQKRWMHREGASKSDIELFVNNLITHCNGYGL
jgi:hypothetical protein